MSEATEWLTNLLRIGNQWGGGWTKVTEARFDAECRRFLAEHGEECLAALTAPALSSEDATRPTGDKE